MCILLDLYPEPRVTDYMSPEQHTSHELCMSHIPCIQVTSHLRVTRFNPEPRLSRATDYMSHEQHTSHEPYKLPDSFQAPLLMSRVTVSVSHRQHTSHEL